MIRDRSRPVRTVSRTKWATCPEGTKSWTDGGSSQTWSTSQGRNVLLIHRLNHDACSSSRKIRLLGQAPRTNQATAKIKLGPPGVETGQYQTCLWHLTGIDGSGQVGTFFFSCPRTQRAANRGRYLSLHGVVFAIFVRACQPIGRPYGRAASPSTSSTSSMVISTGLSPRSSVPSAR